MIAGFFFDSQEDFGGDGSRPEFSGWDAFDWSDLLTKINNLGPPRNQGALAAKWQNLESVHLLKREESRNQGSVRRMLRLMSMDVYSMNIG